MRQNLPGNLSSVYIQKNKIFNFEKSLEDPEVYIFVSFVSDSLFIHF
jgi:hypothetical protein